MGAYDSDDRDIGLAGVMPVHVVAGLVVNCPTCSQPVPRDTEGLIQARVATRIHAERAARTAAKALADVGTVTRMERVDPKRVLTPSDSQKQKAKRL